MKPQDFCDWGGPGCLWQLGSFMNHLKLVNSIPVNTLSFMCSLRKNWVKSQKLITLLMGKLASTKIINTLQIYCIMLTTSTSQAEWYFSATSHGKNACHGIGITIKCPAAYSSLQKATTCHILTPVRPLSFAPKT